MLSCQPPSQTHHSVQKAGPSSVLAWFLINGFLQSPLKLRKKITLTQVSSDQTPRMRLNQELFLWQKEIP